MRAPQENQEGAQGLVISDTELKQVVYAFKCNNSTLQVKGKLNSITIGKNQFGLHSSGVFCGDVCCSSTTMRCHFLNVVTCSALLKMSNQCCKYEQWQPSVIFPSDNCKKMGLVFDDVVGIVDIINCRDVKVQVCTTRSVLRATFDHIRFSTALKK